MALDNLRTDPVETQAMGAMTAAVGDHFFAGDPGYSADEIPSDGEVKSKEALAVELARRGAHCVLVNASIAAGATLGIGLDVAAVEHLVGQGVVQGLVGVPAQPGLRHGRPPGVRGRPAPDCARASARADVRRAHPPRAAAARRRSPSRPGC